MYLDFYGLNKQPFGVTPDPGYLYLSRSHREAMASLYYGIESNLGFMALIAGPGMGKTTLIFRLLDRLETSARTAFLFQTQSSPGEFMRYLLADLGCDTGSDDPASRHGEFKDMLLREAKSNRRVVVFIDEAQDLSDSVLEAVRLLSNFETPRSKLLQIVLSGQPQLSETLARPNLAQLRQRISLLGRLEALAPWEVAEYIGHRLKIAGRAGQDLFTADAVTLIAKNSGGIPRTINNLCFSALSLGFARQRRVIDGSIVREALSDLELPGVSHISESQTAAGRSRLRVATAVAAIVVAGSLSFSSMRLPPAGKPLPASETRQSAAAPESRPARAPGGQEMRQASGTATRKYSQDPRNGSPRVDPGSDRAMTITVEPDEILGRISWRYLNRRLDKHLYARILRLNPQLTAPERLRAGDRLRLPIATADVGLSPAAGPKSEPAGGHPDSGGPASRRSRQ